VRRKLNISFHDISAFLGLCMHLRILYWAG
jgi:hypothetical protein